MHVLTSVTVRFPCNKMVLLDTISTTATLMLFRIIQVIIFHTKSSMQTRNLFENNNGYRCASAVQFLGKDGKKVTCCGTEGVLLL